MEPNANAESSGEAPAFTSTLDVGRWTLDVRLYAHLLQIFLAGLFIYGLWLGDSPLDRTEPFRALVAHQMVQSGHWLVPHLYGEVYLRKPPLIYWIQASVELLLGRGNEFVWRLPSAMGSALLAGFVGWWSGRWFGRSAVLPAGFACLSLIALWDQNRGADIDALNTVFSVVAALCVLELLFGCGRWSPGWTVGLGLSLGAALLLKGPGCLPQVIAAIVGPGIFLRDFKLLRRRWFPLLMGGVIGFALFAAYVIEAKLQLNRLHIPPDPTGWYELVDKIFLQGWRHRLAALQLPFVLIVYAFPASLALPMVWGLIRQLPKDDPNRIRAVALLGTFFITLLIWVLGDNDNPRYEYVVLPLLAPLVGWVWSSTGRLRQILATAVTAAMCIVAIVISVKLVRAYDHATVLLVSSSVAGLIGVATVVAAFSPRWIVRVIAPALIVSILCCAVPMAARKNAERRKKSAANVAAEIRSVIGNATRVSAAGLVRDLPELFYYAKVDVDNYGEFGLPQLAAAGGGHWVVLSQTEQYPAYATILKYIPQAFPKGAHRLHMPDARDVIYVGWYDPPVGVDTHVVWHVNRKTDGED